MAGITAVGDTEFAAALQKHMDDELRARYRPLLAAFFGKPPKWLKDFCDGGPLVLPPLDKS